MQDMTTAVCHGTGYRDTGKLLDSRDSKSYWVARLKDGNCWMTQNLDLDLNGKVLTSADSDINVAKWTSSTGASALWGDTSPNITKYYDPGDKYCNASGCNLTTSANGGHDSQGNYYTYAAATASGSVSKTSGNIDTSICPKGWRLPASNTTTESGSFGYLLSDVTVASATTNPYYFVYGGGVGNSSLSAAGSVGYYWSSTAKDAANAYYLTFNSSSVNPSGSNSRYNGFSVRCVAK